MRRLFADFPTMQEVLGILCTSLGLGILALTFVHAQESPPVAPPLSAVSGSLPAPACEAQVQEQYRQLSAEGLVTVTTASQWGPQLTALASQVRTGRHQYEIKKNQAELAEQNVAQLLEQLRLARQQTSTLQAEVERLKGSPPPSN